MGKIGQRLRKFTGQVLDLPQDVVLDLPRITMIGNVQLYIESHRGVLHFSHDRLRLQLRAGQIEITGRNLVIRAIMIDEVFIEGRIHEIKYISE